ncbi:hypothetical protein [Nitratiruptor sp. YY09-18]|uniref:hypothetical protein n=1 Tax=Nitratiruptor sp. YY09-18 TaxID=2724901 RepID=UPI0019154DDB|nr:hypothetical protein [Nitratiruptor sp. YY09-18]BCD68788.1 hypothetical protein NitYY0918_C1705 [Nitratiruptor sp. YY09-18]
MEKRPQELADSLVWKGLLARFFRYFVGFVILVVLAVYIGLLLFGVNSVEVLYQLNVQEKNLQRNIEYLKKENARLQKEYFELKELEPKQ